MIWYICGQAALVHIGPLWRSSSDIRGATRENVACSTDQTIQLPQPMLMCLSVLPCPTQQCARVHDQCAYAAAASGSTQVRRNLDSFKCCGIIRIQLHVPVIAGYRIQVYRSEVGHRLVHSALQLPDNYTRGTLCLLYGRIIRLGMYTTCRIPVDDAVV